MKRQALASILLIFFLLCCNINHALAVDEVPPTQEQPFDTGDIKIPQKSNPNSQKSGLNFVEFLARYLDTSKYFYEMLMILLVGIYILNYFTGKKANQKMATYWVLQNKEVFEQDFSHVGVTSNPGTKLLDEESANCYKFYASGRVNCSYALTTIELKRRQDLLTMFVFSMIWPERDRISIEIPIDVKGSLPITFAIVKRKEAKAIHANYSDLKAFCKKITFDELEKSYTVLGENTDSAEFILSTGVVAVLKKYERIIQMLYITDQLKKDKLNIRADFILPHDFMEVSKDFKPIIKMILYLVDQLSSFKLSATSRAKAEKDRAVYETLKAKEEAEKRNEELQKKKAEERKSLAEKLKNLPKEKQRKLEEKEHQKEMKKKMNKKVMKIG